EGYRLGVSGPGTGVEVLNTDDTDFGVSGVINTGELAPEPLVWHARSHPVQLRLPPLVVTILRRVSSPAGMRPLAQLGSPARPRTPAQSAGPAQNSAVARLRRALATSSEPSGASWNRSTSRARTVSLSCPALTRTACSRRV